MRCLSDAREAWTLLRQHGSVQALKDSVCRDKAAFIARGGSRSACWKIFLVFDTLEVDEWTRTLTSARSAYDALRAHFLYATEAIGGTSSGSDPLASDNQWSAFEKDKELREEIVQDVVRCMPEMPYFRHSKTQRMLIDILFVYCKLNHDVGYRQGMHELLALIIWITDADALDIGTESKALGQDGAIKVFFDAEHIEHDAFTLFGKVMQGAKPFYLSELHTSIASRSRYIFDDLLPRVDPELAEHLVILEIVPQIYLLRWIRLLFGREFDFDNVLALWDVIFAIDPNLGIVDHVCIAMLLRIRWHLLEADYNTALSLLLRYPELDREFPARTLALDGLYLQTHLSIEGGSILVHKYSGRPMRRLDRPSTPPALQRNITTFSGLSGGQRSSTGSPLRAARGPRDIETILQNTAKNLYHETERLGIGSFVRNAVDEVHKKAQEIREVQAAFPIRHRPSVIRRDDRVKALEERNKRLSSLLSASVAELWDLQKLLLEQSQTDSTNTHEETTERLGTAIAKVQLIQVYLEEPSILLPDDETSAQLGSEALNEDASTSLRDSVVQTVTAPEMVAGAGLVQASSQQSSADPIISQSLITNRTSGLADPSSFEDWAVKSPPTESSANIKTSPQSNMTSRNLSTAPSATKLDPEPLRDRPSLEHSSFSFMLGQQPQAFADMESPTPERIRADASLFASPDAAASPSPARKTPGAKPRGKSAAAAKSTAASHSRDSSSVFGNETAEFDLSSLRHAKGSST